MRISGSRHRGVRGGPLRLLADGDVRVGAVEIGERARVGTHTLVDPGMRGCRCEGAAAGPREPRGARGELWGSSPLRHHGNAGTTFAGGLPEATGGMRTWGRSPATWRSPEARSWWGCCPSWH
ncbi:hypothetical protein QJS66_01870 [Kocuria rhizophila]|nr:hypothetical protein QJS66_01870 [Kocuria rhizophila]